MKVEFCIQDPTNPETSYLYEAIIGAVAEATSWRGVYAFATRGGVDQLIEDPIVHEFMGRGGRVDLIVGLDAVTNRQTLERMQILEARYENFYPKVFWNSAGGLFHPKLSHFSYPDGRKKLIVGSGNLTPGGLKGNFEGYSIISGEREDAFDLSSLDSFIARHEVNIRPIDEAALDRAALNFIRSPVRSDGSATPHRGVQAVERRDLGLDRVLVAQVPKAGGRWSQVHFNTEITEQYFRVTDIAIQRVYLTSVNAAALRAEEEVRRVVFSPANGNHKIEIAAAKGHDYPSSAPILVFREKQARSFEYMLVMPGDSGYDQLLQLSQDLPTIGKGMRRAITDLETLGAAWPECPLLGVHESIREEL